MAESQIVVLPIQPSAAVRVQQAMDELDLGALFTHYLPLVAARLAELGAEPAGAPYGRYHEFGPERVDVEIGIPASEPVTGLPPLTENARGEIGVSELPGGETAMVVHVGPYETLGESHEALQAWIAEQGRTAASGPWESYVDDPGEVDQVRLRTELYAPLVERGDAARR